MITCLKRFLRRTRRLVLLSLIFVAVVVSGLYFNLPVLFRAFSKVGSSQLSTAQIAERVNDIVTTDKRPRKLNMDSKAAHTVHMDQNVPPLANAGVDSSVEANVLRSPDTVEHGESTVSVKHQWTCSAVHVFYYPWYGNPNHDGKYLHWNHGFIPHWNADIAKRYPKGQHLPPADIGSDFYPELGPYSSKDPTVIEKHLKYIASAGIGVIVVSYYPPGQADNEGESWVDVFDLLFEKSLQYNVKVAFHIEPYKGRTELTVLEDIKYIIDTYGSHPALYRYSYKQRRNRPLIYVYDSYHTSPSDWSKILDENGPLTIRNTPYDCIAICLLVEYHHTLYVSEGKFDGFYTYFATDGFTFGSSRHNWRSLSEFSRDRDCLFIPSIGPGYIDTSIRPWNSENTRNRDNGRYYTNAWLSALRGKPHLISITSFNEWHEGTQIEPAVQASYKGRKYRDYSPQSSVFYLQLTKQFVDKFLKCRVENIR